MDIDAAFAARECFKCGKGGHIARECTAPIDEIRRTYGRDSYIPPPRASRAYQARAQEFGSIGEFARALSPSEWEQMQRERGGGGASGSGSGGQASSSGGQGFGGGSE